MLKRKVFEVISFVIAMTFCAFMAFKTSPEGALFGVIAFGLLMAINGFMTAMFVRHILDDEKSKSEKG